MSDNGAPPLLIEPVAAPAPEPAAAPAAPVAAAPAPAAVEAAPAAAPALVPHTDTATLLDAGAAPAADPAVVAAPAAAPVVDPAKEPVKEPAAPAAAPVIEPPAVVTEPVKFEAFVIPEGVTLDQDRIGKFTEVLAQADLAPQARAQQLLDMHVDAMRAYGDQTLQNQHSAFADTRQEWRIRVLADPQLGGAGHGTAMAAIARMRDLFVAPEHRAEFDEWQRVTGSGDNPAPLRLLLNIARRFDEPGTPAPSPKPPPQAKGRPGAVFYGDPPSGTNR